MDIKKSLNWLNKRFVSAKEHKYNSFKVSNYDLEAFNSVVRYISIVNKKRVSKNELFAKLYIYHLNQSIRYYQTDVFESEPHKELSRLLEIPLFNFYEAFHKEIHGAQINNIMERYKKGYKPTLEEFKEKYSIEYVTAQLDLQINQCLNKFE